MGTEKRILVVDDEKDIQVFITKMLEQKGYAVTCAADGEEAHAAIENDRPDLITLDMSMPNKSGIKFYRELKNNPACSAIPVVVVTGITGQGGSNDTERFLNSRGSIPPPEAFVSKPIDEAELTGAVGDLLDQKKAAF